MSVYAYRLYAIQSFKGTKVAVYVCEGNYPDPQVIGDATDIIDGTRTRKEVLEYNDWMYDPREVYPQSGQVNRDRLTYYTRILKRSQKVIDENDGVTHAIFVHSTNKKEWRGERTLYKLDVFDTLKSDTPSYSGVTECGTIEI